MSSTSLENYFQKIENIIQQKILDNSHIFFPCKYMVFHQAKKYCKECQDFICDKCIKKHEESHSILNVNEITQNVSKKINLYLEVTKGKFPKDEKSKEGDEKIELDESIEKSSIEKINNLINQLICIKKKILKFFELRKQLLKEYNSEENKNINNDDSLIKKISTLEKLEIKDINEKEIKNFYDFIKFEKNNTLIIKSFIDFSKSLDNKTNEIISNNDYLNKLHKKDEMSVYEKINLKANELNLIMSNYFIKEVDSFLSKSASNLDSKIISTENTFKNVICSLLQIEDEKYQALLEKTEIDDEPKKIIEKIVEIPKEVEKIVEKVIEKKVEINKTKFSTNELFINEQNKISIFISSTNKITNIDKNINDNNDNNNNENDNNINEKNNEELLSDKEEDDDEDDKDNINELLEPNNFNKMDDNKLNVNKTKNKALKRSTVIQKKGEIGVYASLALSAQNVKDIMKGTYNEAKAVFVIKDNKFLIDSQEEIEEYRKSCYEKLANLNLKKTKHNFNLNKELSLFSYKERNMFELTFPVEDQAFLCIYNPYINKIEEIDIQTDKKFPLNFASFFRLPYCYISGGEIKNKNGEIEELSSFYALRRDGPKIFEKIILPDMIESKCNHCLFEIPYINSICALGGKNSKEVEVYDLDEKNWTNLPDLNNIREGAACCVINDTFLYCFFGYNTEDSSYLTSIEKFDLVYKDKWEILNPYGNKSFMKRKYCGCVKYRIHFEENIYIVGGINVLNSESKDVLIYNEKNNTIEKKKDLNLPYKSSFNSCSFVQLPNNIFYNLSTDYQLIQYEPLGKIFFGIRDN